MRALAAGLIGVALAAGLVSWSRSRAAAIRFHDRQAAADLQEAVVGRYGIACAVVPA